MKNKGFTTEDRLSVERLKRARLPFSGGLKRTLPRESTKETVPVKDLIANLLVPEKEDSKDFERAFVKRTAKEFATWVEKELKRSKKEK
jgi:hypothetical protein